MKNLQEKLLSLFVILKGRKPIVVGLSVAVIALCLLGVKFGYITEDMVNFNVIIESIEGMFNSNSIDASSPSIDTLNKVSDTTNVVVDSLSK